MSGELKPQDFPLHSEDSKIVKSNGKPVADAKSPTIAEDIASRLNEQESRNEEDRWSA